MFMFMFMFMFKKTKYNYISIIFNSAKQVTRMERMDPSYLFSFRLFVK